MRPAHLNSEHTILCPAPAVTAVADYNGHNPICVADGDGKEQRPLSRSTINLYLSAVMQAHHTAGDPFNRKHPLIART
jgi:hypothetical protein